MVFSPHKTFPRQWKTKVSHSALECHQIPGILSMTRMELKEKTNTIVTSWAGTRETEVQILPFPAAFISKTVH